MLNDGSNEEASGNAENQSDGNEPDSGLPEAGIPPGVEI